MKTRKRFREENRQYDVEIDVACSRRVRGDSHGEP
jgi:hypothetical protein